jgi:hypothetical protein
MTSRWDYDSLFIDGAWTASDVTRRRRQCPWYTAKTTPSSGDMLARLRRQLREARISGTLPGQSHLSQIDDHALTCDTIAA